MASIPWWVQLLGSGFGTAVLSALGWLFKRLFDWAGEKTKLDFLKRLDDLVMAVISDIYNTLVQQAKNAKADGKLTEHERQRFKTMAIQAIKGYLGTKGMTQLIAILGGKAASVDGFLGAAVEKQITASKNAARGSSLRVPFPQQVHKAL